MNYKTVIISAVRLYEQTCSKVAGAVVALEILARSAQHLL
jgi:hypothetical protein